MKNTHKLIFTLVLCCQFTTTQAQYTDVINSNRPGASQSAFSVGTKVLQFELGPYLVKEKRSLYPNYEVSGYGVDFAVHYGIWKEALELNVQGTYQNDTQSFTSNAEVDRTRANFKNLNIGVKYLVYDPNKNKDDKPNLYSYHANRGFKWSSLIPAVSVAGGVNFDTKNNPYTAATVDGLSYRGVLITQNNFAGGWVVVTNFMLDRIGSDQTDLNYILSLTHSFNPKWVMFAETQGIKSDFYADNLFRFGGGYLLGKNLQLDTALTLNIKDTPSVLNISFGASYRIDRHDTSN
jgi:hypothetical protein|tara:strand:- start:6869 stop:7747 length:879 start_codon:yes stop_codon:yes gene_type:complete